ncbi:MAG: hypothetical protein RL072_548 [Actinomycetota bacterium]
MNENRLYYAYARHALVTAMRLVRVGGRSVVLIPDFICRDVLAPLAALGAEAVFYSIDDDLQISTSNSLPEADAIIAVNYFGFPADLARIRKRLASPRTAIIEDNAHGWLSKDRDGSPLGSRTDVGITSLRKTIRLPDGACIEWRLGADLDVKALHDPLAPRNERLPLGFMFRRTVQRLDLLSPISLMGLGRRTVRSLRRLRGNPPVDERPSEEWELPLHRAIHRRSLDLISRVNQNSEIQRRRELFTRCMSAAQRLSIETPTPELSTGVSPQGFPFFGDSGDVAAFIKLVRRERLGETIAWPALPNRSPLPATSRLRTLRLVNFLA